MAKSATVKEKKHLDRVAGMGCIACVNSGFGETEAEIHHISNGTMGKRASNFEVIPLCHAHHRTGGYGIAVHSGRKAWESEHGTEQELLIQTMEWLSL